MLTEILDTLTSRNNVFVHFSNVGDNDTYFFFFMLDKFCIMLSIKDKVIQYGSILHFYGLMLHYMTILYFMAK